MVPESRIEDGIFRIPKLSIGEEDVADFIRDVTWDCERILSKDHEMVADDLADLDGTLIFDESGFVKKGGDSACVGRQYCGSIGKVEDSQVGVFSA
jgi:SRSO17 transposase